VWDCCAEVPTSPSAVRRPGAPASHSKEQNQGLRSMSDRAMPLHFCCLWQTLTQAVEPHVSGIVFRLMAVPHLSQLCPDGGPGLLSISPDLNKSRRKPRSGKRPPYPQKKPPQFGSLVWTGPPQPPLEWSESEATRRRRTSALIGNQHANCKASVL